MISPTSNLVGMAGRAGLCGFLVCLCATLLIAVSRTYATAALDRAAPLGLGRFSRRFGTPTVATILSGLVATVTAVAAIWLSAYGSETIGALFIQVLGVSISTALLAYQLMIPTFLILRYTYRAIPRRYLQP